MREIIFSVDIETLGDIPGVSSMINLGCAAFNPEDEKLIGTFGANIDRLPNDIQTKGNKGFWDKHPAQLAEFSKNTVAPVTAMLQFRDFVRGTCARFTWPDPEKGAYVPARPVALACPAAWDFGTFIYWYFNYFLGEDSSPFKHRALDLRTVISMVMNVPYNEAGIETVPDDVVPKERRDRMTLATSLQKDYTFGIQHDGVIDAMEQGIIYLGLRRRWQKIVRDAAMMRELDKRQRSSTELLTRA